MTFVPERSATSFVASVDDALTTIISSGVLDNFLTEASV
ncbi:MAG: hypothetical protein ACD_36C00030G0002 [uncultured bacterium]|nr:MAG: hypothetical protein ACD_36C00030G0002 [uncultured bacterium]